MDPARRERTSSLEVLGSRSALPQDGQGHRAPVMIGALAVAALGGALVALTARRQVAEQMFVHVAMMNFAAPMLATALARSTGVQQALSRLQALWPLTMIQMLLLGALHLPGSQIAAAESLPSQHLIHIALFGCAVLFWSAIISTRQNPWHAALALLLTAKLVCLMGALLVFAPRPLYAISGDLKLALEDQQLAGLIMIAACPLSYVLVAVGIAASSISLLGAAGSERLRSA